MPLSAQRILDYLASHPNVSSEDIRRAVAPELSRPTFWRRLSHLVSEQKIEVSGKARATRYRLARGARVRAHLSVPFQQRPPTAYRKEFIDRYVPGKSAYLTEHDRLRLHEAGKPDSEELPAETRARRILEQLLVDLSWASSRMEGNTYSILETEMLIQVGREVPEKDRKEAVMILNHKEAIRYVADHLRDIDLRTSDITSIHALLADGLLVDPAMSGRLRRMPAAIGGSNYRPLDDRYSIEEEFNLALEKAAEIRDPFEQSFFLLVHIPYLQAFEDVNRRTSRIAANIPLLKSGLAPMSFLTMNDSDYVDGILGVYELNDVSLLRDAYLAAYTTSARNYKILKAEVDVPEKAALTYRSFVRAAVRRCVLDWKKFDARRVSALAGESRIPEEDLEAVVRYVEREFRGLHEGNVIRYRVTVEDLEGVEL